MEYILSNFGQIQKTKAGIVQSVQRRAKSWTAGVRFPAAARYFSLFHRVQTGSEALSISYPTETGGYF
jgi:hypothetical protein